MGVWCNRETVYVLPLLVMMNFLCRRSVPIPLYTKRHILTIHHSERKHEPRLEKLWFLRLSWFQLLWSVSTYFMSNPPLPIQVPWQIMWPRDLALFIMLLSQCLCSALNFINLLRFVSFECFQSRRYWNCVWHSWHVCNVGVVFTSICQTRR